MIITKINFIILVYISGVSAHITWKLYCTENKVIKMEGNHNSSTSIFNGERDKFNGIIIKSENNLCSDESIFTSKLENSLEKWKKDGVRGLWFNISLEYAFWVPILAKNGFTFHHAEGNMVMMTKWLPENEVSGIPNYAHTMTGAGAIVVNAQNEILVVTEKNKVLNTTHWKLPGGYIEQGETIADAAVREVFEETGIKTKFESLVAFRHSQRAAFGCCDLYFIVELSPISTDDNKIVLCSREIEACQWMKIEEYANHPNVLDNNKMIAKNYLACKRAGIRIKGEKSFHQLLQRQQTFFTVDIGS
ncbi:nucleoside diphosphate-linked moiety X motif 6 isoform X2 [Lycorma delicatula]|uniref:nucleoside diphosphate-linked moiety X motif 6 isoform X2 n=1 Tax=Lycorma delicatula TaxID=130591 RepID=UPI003F50D885